MKPLTNQSGAVLFVALVFLLMSAALSTTIMKTSIFEVRMSGNEQINEEAFQKNQGLINAVSKDVNNFVITGDIGYMNCAAGSTGCDSHLISLSTATTATHAHVTLDYQVERVAPLFAPLPFRLADSVAVSASNFNATFFEVQTEYDGTSNGLGSSSLAQGVAVIVNAGGQ